MEGKEEEKKIPEMWEKTWNWKSERKGRITHKNQWKAAEIFKEEEEEEKETTKKILWKEEGRLRRGG